MAKRSERKRELDLKIKRCRKCPGLNIPKQTMSAPGYGDLRSPVLLLGQSLHAYNADFDPQIPFVGPYGSEGTKGRGYDSGDVLFEGLELADLSKEDVFITNVQHCHPPGNRPSTKEEIKNCQSFLLGEISIVRPTFIICLGRQAQDKMIHLKSFYSSRRSVRDAKIIFIYHPSYFLRRGDKKEIRKWQERLARMLRRCYGK